MLCTQLKYAEALAMVEPARAAASKDLPLLEDLQARTLYILGDREKAQAIFARRAAEIKEGVDVGSFDSLLDAEYRAGLKDQAFAHCPGSWRSSNRKTAWRTTSPGRWSPRSFPRRPIPLWSGGPFCEGNTPRKGRRVGCSVYAT